MRSINVGGLHYSAGRVQKLRYVFLSPDEEQVLRDLASRGVEDHRAGRARATPARSPPRRRCDRGPRRMTLLPIAPSSGAIGGLNVVSFPQAMISRPIVAATVGGAFAGNAGAGLLVGAAVELIALETLPVGRVSLSGVGIGVGRRRQRWRRERRPGSPGPVPMTMLAALATAWVGGWTMIALRSGTRSARAPIVAELERGSATTSSRCSSGA